MTLQAQLEKIARRLQPKIENALNNEVADAVVETETRSILEVVYDAYTPKIYNRRGDWGGMADPLNIEHRVADERLHVWNSTEPNPGGTLNNARVTTGKSLAQLIESGHGKKGGNYDFPRYGRGYMKPRPFTGKTVKALKASKKHVKALKSGLKRQGIETK